MGQADIALGVRGQPIRPFQAAVGGFLHPGGADGVEGQVVTPGRHQKGDTLRCGAAQHALKGDAQGVHQVRLHSGEEFQIACRVGADCERADQGPEFTVKGDEDPDCFLNAGRKSGFGILASLTHAAFVEAAESQGQDDGLANTIHGLIGVGGNQADLTPNF